MTTVSDIQEFLGHKRLAFIGVSRDPTDFSRRLFRDLVKRGYDPIPVNPGAKEIEGRRCFARIDEVTPPVDSALIMTPPSATDEVVRECDEAHVQRVWLHRGGGQGAVTGSAVTYCQNHEMSVVAGFCPYMFLPDTAFFHRVHGFALKLSGRYPART